MKNSLIISAICVLIFLGAGCAKTSIQQQETEAVSEQKGFIDRRIEAPPEPPPNIPLPTPIQPTTTIEE